MGRNLLSFILLVFAFLLSVGAFQGTSWQEPDILGTLPSARSFHKMERFGNTLYVFGGSDVTGLPLNDLWSFDLTTFKWTEREPEGTIPAPRKAFASAKMGDEWWIFYGWDFAHWPFDYRVHGCYDFVEIDQLGSEIPSVNYTCTRDPGFSGKIKFFQDTYVLNIPTLTWRRVIPVGDVPPTGEGMATCTFDDLIYWYGGSHWNINYWNFTDNNHVYVLNTSQTPPRFTRLPNLGSLNPLGKSGHSIAVSPAAHQLYILNGEAHSDGLTDTRTAEILVYNLINHTWTSTWPDYPNSFFHTVIPLNGLYYYFGGRCNGPIFNIVKTHPPSNTSIVAYENWRFLQPEGTPPEPRYQHAACDWGNTMVVFGGYDDTSHYEATIMNRPLADGVPGGSKGVYMPTDGREYHVSNDLFILDTTPCESLCSHQGVCLNGTCSCFPNAFSTPNCGPSELEKPEENILGVVLVMSIVFLLLILAILGVVGYIAKLKMKRELPSWWVFPKEVEVQEEIGRGGFGVVYRGLYNKSEVAIKQIPLVGHARHSGDHSGGSIGQNSMVSRLSSRSIRPKKFRKAFQSEVNLLAGLRHNNIMFLMGAWTDSTSGYIVLELMELGSLRSVLKTYPDPIPWQRRLQMAWDGARGMCHLHNQMPPVLHRDVSSSNFLVSTDWTLKVGDFGLATVRRNATGIGLGALAWVAPEVLKNQKKISDKSDVYGYGIILHELFSRTEPYPTLSSAEILKGVRDFDLRPFIPQGCDPKYQDLIERCWSPLPFLRPNFNAIEYELNTLVKNAQVEQSTMTGDAVNQPTLQYVFPKDEISVLEGSIERPFKELSIMAFEIPSFSENVNKNGLEQVLQSLAPLFKKIEGTLMEHGIHLLDAKWEDTCGSYLAFTGLQMEPAQSLLKAGRALLSEAKSTTIEGFTNPQVRLGIHCGPCKGIFVGKAFNLIGDSVFFTQRLCASAQPFTVTLSSSYKSKILPGLEKEFPLLPYTIEMDGDNIDAFVYSDLITEEK